jgi:hypothetical protein
MAGKKIGYIKVSSCDQNSEGQLEGVKLDKILSIKLPEKRAITSH